MEIRDQRLLHRFLHGAEIGGRSGDELGRHRHLVIRGRDDVDLGRQQPAAVQEGADRTDRAFAASSVSSSRPPAAANRLPTLSSAIPGTEMSIVLMAPAATLPRTPPPNR